MPYDHNSNLLERKLCKRR